MTALEALRRFAELAPDSVLATDLASGARGDQCCAWVVDIASAIDSPDYKDFEKAAARHGPISHDLNGIVTAMQAMDGREARAQVDGARWALEEVGKLVAYGGHPAGDDGFLDYEKVETINPEGARNVTQQRRPGG